MISPRDNLRDFHLAGWFVQPSLDQLSSDGIVTRIRPQLMDVLICLADRAGRTVTRQEFVAAVWSGRFVGDSGLARCVAELRRALGDSARAPRFIETIPKRGYRLIAPVVVAAVQDPEADRAALRRSLLDRALEQLAVVAIGLGARFRGRRSVRSLMQGDAIVAAGTGEARAL